MTNKIISAVCEYYNVTEEQLRGASRKKQIALARMVVMYLLRKNVNHYFCDIAHYFNRHHATGAKLYDNVHGLLKIGDKQMVKDIAEITEMIKRKEGEIIEGVIGDNAKIPVANRPVWRKMKEAE